MDAEIDFNGEGEMVSVWGFSADAGVGGRHLARADAQAGRHLHHHR